MHLTGLRGKFIRFSILFYVSHTEWSCLQVEIRLAKIMFLNYSSVLPNVRRVKYNAVFDILKAKI